MVYRLLVQKKNQYVLYNSCKSEYKNILCGVPQGSILGPLLFILSVNDITNTSNVLEFVLFADDTTITYSHSDVMSKFDMINSELSVNASKTNYMLLGTNHKLSRLDESASIILDNTTLKRVNNFSELP